MAPLYRETAPSTSSRDTRETLFFSIREAANQLGVGRTLMQELLDSGRIRSVRAGRRRLVPVDALREFAKQALVGEADRGACASGRRTPLL
jgi:excisionase family DNA binding protein